MHLRRHLLLVTLSALPLLGVAAAATGCSLALQEEAGDGDGDGDGDCPTDWLLTANSVTNGDERVAAVAVVGCETYICGTYNGNFTELEQSVRGIGEDDIFVAKLDRDGEVVWAAGFGSAATDTCTSIAADSDQVVVGGIIEGSITFRNFDHAVPGGTDGLIASFTAMGSFSFMAAITGNGAEEVHAVALDGSEILVAGAASGNGEYKAASTTPINTDEGNFVMLRLDDTGVLRRAKAFADGLPPRDAVTTILPANDSIIVGAKAARSFGFPVTCEQTLVNGGGLIISLSASTFDCEWAIAADSPNEDSIEDLVVVPGGYLGVGTTESSALTSSGGSVTVNVAPTNTLSGYTIFVNDVGVVSEVGIYGSSMTTAFHSVVQRDDPAELVVLSTFSGAWNIGGGMLTAGGLDSLLLALSPEAESLVTDTLVLAGSGSQDGTSLEARHDSSLVVAGAFDTEFDFDGKSFVGPEGDDLFVAPIENW